MAEEKTIDKTDLFSSKVKAELEKLAVSINSMMENMRKMEHPILESKERLPKANEQLDKVSAQTEAATHTMLDMVEQIIGHEEKTVQVIEEVAEFIRKRSRSKRKDDLLQQLSGVKQMAEESQNNAFLIMDALQFQDITSQQMNHASSLLEDIEHRLHSLVNVFNGEELPDIQELGATKKPRAFDPDADMFERKDQKEVDNIVSKANTTD